PVKLPYYAISPGPVEDVADLITVGEATVYESGGKFYLLTVGLREVNAFEWFEARFLDSRVDLLDREVVRPHGVSQEQVTRTNLELMNESIDTAIFVALERVGYEVSFVGEGVEVLEVVEGSPAFGVIEVGDTFHTIAGEPVTLAEQAGDIIRSHAIGDTITLEGTRAEEPITLEITLGAHPDIEGAPMVGVLFDTLNLDLDLPIEVAVDSRNIGGPSAGMTYALTIIDLLTPGDLTKGHVIAGTGTIRFDETVGAIGGVRQKVFAARAIGVEIIFVPQDNYADALTAAGDGVEIVPVTTLQEALDYLEALEPVTATVAAP
ncbi:MAG TPA: S16 family serine protease, partial [Acidimicrobiia bacterium]|nr:S16 family serine protease [Acidimicrobiia bacterium]